MTTAAEKISSLMPINTITCTRDELREYFTNSWELQEALFKSLSTDHALYLNPDRLRNPLIFYLGHTAAFYINKLRMAGLLRQAINPAFEDLFASGVDPETPEELERVLQYVVWPEAGEVWEYRVKCFQAVIDLIDRAELKLPVGPSDPMWALLMAIEHDRIHFETSSVLLRQLPVTLFRRPEGWHYAPTLGSPPHNDLIYVPGEIVHLGKPQNFPTYGWDNEYGQLAVKVAPFYASKYLVSNQEFLAFVQDGGYRHREHWCEEAWAWRQKQAITLPRFWVRAGDDYRYRALFDEIPMPWDWPVEVNHHEAMAYCRWRGPGVRLLTEAEWNLLVADRTAEGGTVYEDDRAYSGLFNLHLKFGSPSPVHMLEAAKSQLGFFDVLGNVWVWLSNAFYPLPGFRSHHLYEDFSLPFFDEKHSMMLGGSWATTGTGASMFYRLWFRRYFYQHAGFRIARS